MTRPALASTGPNGHRVYTWAGREYLSVTAIISGGVPKPFLPRWAAKAAAEYAIGNLDHLRLLPSGQAIREVKQAPWAKPDPAAGYLAGFDRFVAQRKPVFLLAERTVYSRRYGYAGTFDLLATLPGLGVVLLDVKTGNRVYPEVCLQLAAYAAGDFIGDPDGTTERPLPTIHAGAVLHLRPGGYHLLPIPISRAVLEAFLAALAVFRFSTDLAPTLLPRADDELRSEE